jgi:hypothetical protein
LFLSLTDLVLSLGAAFLWFIFLAVPLLLIFLPSKAISVFLAGLAFFPFFSSSSDSSELEIRKLCFFLVLPSLSSSVVLENNACLYNCLKFLYKNYLPFIQLIH